MESSLNIVFLRSHKVMKNNRFSSKTCNNSIQIIDQSIDSRSLSQVTIQSNRKTYYYISLVMNILINV